MEIVDTAKETGARVAGPIPLPTTINKYCVLRSPHVNKKSREQFEIRTHKRLMDILEPTQQTVDALMKLDLAAGVDVEIKSDIFNVNDIVHVIGISKGRGFSGVIKRWGFSGGRKTHGSRSHRIPGSIGCSATPGRVQKGKKLPGRMGCHRVTIKNLKVVGVRPEMDVVLVRGAVPGSSNGFIEISKV